MRGRHSGLSFAFDDSPATQEHLCAVEHLYAWMFGQPDAEAVQRNHDTVIEMQMHNHANRTSVRRIARYWGIPFLLRYRFSKRP